MNWINAPLIILQSFSLIAIVIIYFFYKNRGHTPFFMEPIMWILNTGGFYYALYGSYIKDHFILKSGLVIITISYGIWFSFILDRFENFKKENKEKK